MQTIGQFGHKAKADPITFHVSIDTTPIAGTSGFVAFDLLGGSPLQGNTATIVAFATTGVLGSSSTAGECYRFTDKPTSNTDDVGVLQ